MARRIIRTIDRQVFSGSCGRFVDRKGYVLYRRGAFNTVRINKRGIISDDISGLSTSEILVLVVIMLMALMIGLLLLSQGVGVAKRQDTPSDFSRAAYLMSRGPDRQEG